MHSERSQAIKQAFTELALAPAKAQLLDLPNELLCQILDEVKPNDIENFSMSCKRIYDHATKRLERHKLLKKQYTIVQNVTGPFAGANHFSKLLYVSLIEPRKADYVRHIYIELRDRSIATPEEDLEHGYFDPRAESTMEVFEKAVRSTDSIPSTEKQRWIDQIYNLETVVALLLPRLTFLTNITILIIFDIDDFLLPTLRRIAKDPHSPSLCSLREVEILGLPELQLSLATAFAALPSVVSLKSSGLRGDGDQVGCLLAAGCSNLQSIKLDADWTLPCAALTNLIKSTRSLRSFSYGQYSLGGHPLEGSDVTSFTFTWLRAALFQYASISLEELSLRSYYLDYEHRKERSFKNFQRLRVLDIDLAILIGTKIRALDLIVTLLPESLEILTLFACKFPDTASFKELVMRMLQEKGNHLPLLKQLCFEASIKLNRLRHEDFEELAAAATEAGIELNLDGMPQSY